MIKLSFPKKAIRESRQMAKFQGNLALSQTLPPKIRHQTGQTFTKHRKNTPFSAFSIRTRRSESPASAQTPSSAYAVRSG
jgi:hypothetical protein